MRCEIQPPATSVRRRRTCEVRPESSVENPAKNVQDKSKCFGGDSHRMRRSARRAERSAVLGVHGPKLGAKFRLPATSVRRRRTCEVRPESSVENPAKNVQEKSKCFGGDAHQLRMSARRAERSAVLGVHGPRLGAKFRPPATSVRRRRTCEVRPESIVENPAKNVQDKSKCFGGDAHQMRRSARRAERSAVLGVHGVLGTTARSSVRNSDPQRPRFAVGGRAKFGRNRASKSRRKTAEKMSKCFGGDAHQLRRSARRAERSAVLGVHGPRLGAKFRPPATSVRRRRTCEVRPESRVENPAKNVQDKSKCFGGDLRSARRAERSAVLGVHGPRLGAKFRPPATSVRRRRTCEVRPESRVEKPAKNVQDKSKCFGGDAHQMRRSARRRNGRPCSGCTARGSVRNSDPQRPRFAVGGRAKFGRNRASKSRRKTARKSRSDSKEKVKVQSPDRIEKSSAGFQASFFGGHRPARVEVTRRR